MNRKLDVVITMAGLGSRFRKAGYKVPKYMIEAHGKTLFECFMTLVLFNLPKTGPNSIFLLVSQRRQRITVY